MPAVGLGAGAAADGVEEDVDLERFGQDGEDVVAADALELTVGERRGQDNDAAHHVGVLGGQVIEHREAVDLGHAQVEDHRRVLARAQLIDRFQTIANGFDFILALEQRLDERTRSVVVVRKQNEGLVH